MISKEQFTNGVLLFVEREVIPHLPTAGKWCVGTLVCLSKNKLESVLDQYINNDMIKALGIVDGNGMIDSCTLLNALEESANKYGKLTVQIPVLGTLSFSSQDVDKLNQYLNDQEKMNTSSSYNNESPANNNNYFREVNQI